MTDLAVALANPPGTLTGFEGHDVIRAAVEVPNAGGGLHDAMAFEPRELSLGEEVYLVMRCTVRKVRFDPHKDDPEALTRVHVLRAEEATFVEGALVDAQLTEQRERIQRAKDAASGQGRLDDELLEAEMRALHAEGQHDAAPDDRCPTCAEVAAEDG